MPIYFLAHEAPFIHQQLRPALGDCRRRRSFVPVQALCTSLLPTVEDFCQRFHLQSTDTLVHHAARGLGFDRATWRCLAGEILFYAAREVPDFAQAEETLTALLAPALEIHAVHHGSREIDLGGFVYRPEQAGLNDVADVARLAAFLCAVNADGWQLQRPDADAEELAQELEYTRQCWRDLADFYGRAAAAGWVVVCEQIP